METVNRLLESISRELRPVEERVRNHPFAPALEAGDVSEEKLRTFAGEQYGIISSDIRSVAYLLARAGNPASRAFFEYVLPGEQAAMANLLGFAAALGLDEDDLISHRVHPGAQAYKTCMAWLALQRPHSEVAAAFLVNFPAWGSVCGRIAAALRANYGMDDAGVAFFVGFAESPPEFSELAKAVIAEGLNRGDCPDGIRSACRLLQEYELMFWDTLL